MRKIIYILFTVLFLQLCTFASDESDVLAVFDNYVNAANSYSTNVPDYYTDNAKIIRIVNKKEGGQKAVVIPFDRYLKELKGHSTLAKTVGYKNTYVNRKVTKVEGGYKVSATRIPRNDKTGLSSYFIFTKTDSGWKIKEESMTTNVQTFLSAK